MVNVDHSMELMQEETFAPIMPIMKVRMKRKRFAWQMIADLA